MKKFPLSFLLLPQSIYHRSLELCNKEPTFNVKEDPYWVSKLSYLILGDKNAYKVGKRDI